MELDQLRTLIAVVDLGSYSAAGRQLGASRVTLRARLDTLEQELGAPLLISSNQGSTPTATGRWLLKRARRVVEEVDELARAARELHGEVRGELRLMIPVGMPPDLVSGFANLMRTQYPELTLCVVFGDSLEAAAAHDPDFIFHLGPPWTGGLYRTTLVARAPLQLLGARAYLERRGRPDSLEAIGEHPLLAWDMPGSDPLSLPLANGEALAIAPWFISKDAHLLRAMVARGEGLALLPQSDATRGVPGEDLEAVLPEQIGAQFELRALIPESRAGSARCRAVSEVMRWIRDAQPHLQDQGEGP